MTLEICSQIRQRSTSDAGLLIPAIAGLAAQTILLLEPIMAAAPATDQVQQEILEGAETARGIVALADDQSWYDDDLSLLHVESFAMLSGGYASCGIPLAHVRLELGVGPDASWMTLVDALTATLSRRFTEQSIDNALALQYLAVVASARPAKRVPAATVGGRKKWTSLTWTRNPLFSQSLRPVHALIANRMRQADSGTSWPKILRSALQAFDNYRLFRQVISVAACAETLEERWSATMAELTQLRKETERSERRSIEEARRGERAAVQAQRVRHEEDLARLRAERDKAVEDARAAREKASRIAAHVDGLKAEIEALEHQCAMLEAAQQGDEDKVSAGASPLTHDIDTRRERADIWNGRRVLIFTNQARGSARADMEARARGLGAERVEVYWVSRSRGPETFPPDAVVIVDVSFMGHADSEALRQTARRAGCFCFEGRHGASTLCEAAADAWVRWRAVGTTMG